MKDTATRTYGQIAVRWFKYKIGMSHFDADQLIFKGKREDIVTVAAQVAPLHPGFSRYFSEAMATLWKGPAGGTGNPAIALTYDVPERYKWVAIWRPLVYE